MTGPRAWSRRSLGERRRPDPKKLLVSAWCIWGLSAFFGIGGFSRAKIETLKSVSFKFLSFRNAVAVINIFLQVLAPSESHA
jgi:hypothetical protein